MNLRRILAKSSGRVYLPVLLITVAAAGTSMGIWHRLHLSGAKPLIYSADGLGGYVSEPRAKPILTPIQRATDAYAGGRYADAEQAAEALIQQAQSHPSDQEAQHTALLARRIDAYSAAHRNDFRTARDRFEGLRQAAYESPDHGKQRLPIGEVASTLEEEGAFQEAVCTGKIEGAKAAEKQYDDFLRNYPDSILVHAATKRVARYHGGDVPKETESLWKNAMQIQKADEKARVREESLCGPRCLGELLTRRVSGGGYRVSAIRPVGGVEVHDLANEMGTSEEGTSVKQWIAAAKKHGIPAKGVSLTAKGLQQQKLPVLALIQPGHFVLVNQVTAAKVRIWDPDVQGPVDYATAKWKESWNGEAVLLR